ncbi:hypothetical protein CHS0354_024019 [Potamilus streckersoni]|uniref:CTP synthase n=1 Tax=Potamilus streckersoni TaxID=2493646 RepID=A0AAE0RZ90_9BIVA|nr:hypothetical protein CHS0354_024019 [Potamilus streckersoni]
MSRKKAVKYIFVTGGVVSSLGKGILSASIGALLKQHGLRVTIQKYDPYINVDPGTMSPFQHGEVFVTEDGAETDLDLGHYERFLDAPTSRENNLTMGQVYLSIIERERKGDFLGKTVQVIPHVVDEIKARMQVLGKTNSFDVVITEIGGTVGDMESSPFLEAMRQLKLELGTTAVLNIHLALVPFIKSAGELKTKPTQHSVRMLLEIGIQPDILICRSEQPLPSEIKKKIGLFCNLNKKNVISFHDIATIYEAPLLLSKEEVPSLIFNKLKIHPVTEKPSLKVWEAFVHGVKHPEHGTVTIAICGKYVEYPDAYKSILESFIHAGVANKVKVDIVFLRSEDIENKIKTAEELLAGAHAVLIAPGFGYRGIEGKIEIIRYARENMIPLFGICLGMQCAVIEFARHVCKLEHATSSEFQKKSKFAVIDIMKNQQKINQKGGTMRLGSYACSLLAGSKMEKIYGKPLINERHRHRYETHGMLLSGISPDGVLVEAIELPSHPWFIGVQFHPELKSRVSQDGGMTVAEHLAGKDIDVTLIDKKNHHLFQPLLYQVASASLTPGDVAMPIRTILRGKKNIDVIYENVVNISLEQRIVVLQSGRECPFDFLVIAIGTRHSYFGNNEWEEYAPGLKTLDDAMFIRKRMLLAFERAKVIKDKHNNREQIHKTLRFVMIGGGPTGVEVAGALAEISNKVFLPDFPMLRKDDIHIVIIEAGTRLLPTFPNALSTWAKHTLQEMGVSVYLNETVENIEKGSVTTSLREIATDNIVWAAGNEAPSLLKSLNCPTDKSTKNVFVIGDAAAFKNKDGFLPGVAQTAIQQGRYVANLIMSSTPKKYRKPFKYYDKGNMAVIGRGKAIVSAANGRSILTSKIIPIIVTVLNLTSHIELQAQKKVTNENSKNVSVDQKALIEFYYATNGKKWRNNTNWLSNKPLNKWYGVVTDEEGRVRELDLSDNQLNGKIPPNLGNLTNLEWLDLGFNQLNGTIPNSFGKLTKLEMLFLNNNQLTGEIPKNLGDMAKLEWLYLNENQLTGSIPGSLGNLTKLTKLYLNENLLTGTIPDSIGNLAKLELLYLNENRLTDSIPSSLGSLKKLSVVSLWENQLSGQIPSSLGNLTKLEILYLNKNQLKGTIPTTLGKLSNLSSLYLWGNQLTGTIPTNFGNLKNLTKLDLNKNLLTGSIPSSLGNLTSLTILDLSYNKLTGEIPSSLGKLSELEWLLLGFNQLTGEIPKSFGNLLNLTKFYLGGNKLRKTPDLEGNDEVQQFLQRMR